MLSSIKYGANPLLNQSVFHELSSFEAYTELYPNALNARSVSELLLLRSDVPRSLHACIGELSHILADLPGSYGRTAQRLAAEFEARLRYTGIDEILEDGLHSRLTVSPCGGVETLPPKDDVEMPEFFAHAHARREWRMGQPSLK